MRLVSKYYSTVQYFVCEFRQNARTIFDADDSVARAVAPRAAFRTGIDGTLWILQIRLGSG